jgi:hypothetical protein
MTDKHDNTYPRGDNPAHRDWNGEETPGDADLFAVLHALDQQPEPNHEFVAKLGHALGSGSRKDMMLSTTTEDLQASAPIAMPHAGGSGSRRRIPLISFGSAAVLICFVVLAGLTIAIWGGAGSDDDVPVGGLATTAEATAESTSEAMVDGCTVEPKTLGYVSYLLQYVVYGIDEANPGDGVNLPPAVVPETDTSWQPPAEGTPADSESVSRVEEVYRQYIACGNGRDQLRLLALMTDDGIARYYAPNGTLNLFHFALIAQPAQPGALNRPLDEFVRVEELPDGRLVGYLPLDPGYVEGSEGSQSWVIFKNVDGHWLIDDSFFARG